VFGKKKSHKKSNSLSETKTVKKNISLKITLDDGNTLCFGNAQHQGRRPYQEDSFGFSTLSNNELLNSKGVLAVLADGMGGLSNGKEVSSLVVSSMLEYFNNPDTVCRSAQHLFQLTEHINEEVCKRFCPDGQIQAGSTVVSALVHKGFLHWLCIGDSRIYLKRKDMLYQLNEDHDYLNTLLEDAFRGRTSYEDAFCDPQKDVLVSCIGNSELPEADYSINGLELEKGDVIALCSDGIYNAITKETFKDLLSDDAQASAQRIEKEVLRQNFQNQDNLTIIVISVN